MAHGRVGISSHLERSLCSCSGVVQSHPTLASWADAVRSLQSLSRQLTHQISTSVVEYPDHSKTRMVHTVCG